MKSLTIHAKWILTRRPSIGVRAWLATTLVALVAITACGSASPKGSTQTGAGLGPLHTDHGQIVDASGQRFGITGVNWFGFETSTYAPQGLWARNWESMLDQIAGSGFNTVRLPYSNKLFKPDSKPIASVNGKPEGINYKLNPDLKGLSGLRLMDKIIDGAGKRGLRVILDQHRPDDQAQSDLWYSGDVTQQRWVDDWVMLAQHYQGNTTIIGADLHNEPHGPATWGTGKTDTDWRLAAQRAGNAVLKVNSAWLIFVQGIEKYKSDYYWWGGNLEGAAQYPVQLSRSDKLVYEAHDYGPDIYKQKWFKASNFPSNMAGVWSRYWGYLQQKGIAPVLVGEFGGSSAGQSGVWQRTLVGYLRQHQMGYTYWAWNPNSGDTGGLLNSNWQTVDKAKMDILSAYQSPRVGGSGPSANVPNAYHTPGK